MIQVEACLELQRHRATARALKQWEACESRLVEQQVELQDQVKAKVARRSVTCACIQCKLN